MDISSFGRYPGHKKAFSYFLNAVIAVYTLVILFYSVYGPVRFSFLGIKIIIEGLFNPVAIIIIATAMRAFLAITWNKKRIFDAIIISVSTIMALASMEIYFRVRYPDDVMAPMRVFNQKAHRKDNDRGPFTGGPKPSGTTRIMAQGDSVTWGMGVADYKELYPYKLLAALNEGSKKYDMQVWSQAGMQVDYHAEVLANHGMEVDPDIIIYQWFINDTEIMLGRPKPIAAPWRKNPLHGQLKRFILYRFVDSRIYALIYRQGEQYAEYLNQNMVPYHKGWWLFAREFHKWATYANSIAPRTIMLIYPSLPYSGDEYPFAKVTESVISLTRPHVMKIPAAYLPKREGTEEKGLGSTYELARVARMENTRQGHITFGPYINFRQGSHQSTFSAKLLSATPKEAKVALLEVVSGVGSAILASRMVTGADFDQVGQWQKFTLPFTVEQRLLDKVEFRVEWFDEADLALDTIEIPVDYQVEVVYPMEKLRTFNTHVKLFDAHPNARAHSVMAEALAEQVRKRP